jgi:hypothetical protein
MEKELFRVMMVDEMVSTETNVKGTEEAFALATAVVSMLRDCDDIMVFVVDLMSHLLEDKDFAKKFDGEINRFKMPDFNKILKGFK